MTYALTNGTVLVSAVLVLAFLLAWIDDRRTR